MTPDSHDGKGAPSAELTRFVQQRLPAISEAFAASPLMQLRVSTGSGSVLLVKAASRMPDALAAPAGAEAHRAGRHPHEYLPDAEPGRAYDMVSAEVVGIFHAAPDLPEIGEHAEKDRALGYIESLKVRTPIIAGVGGRLVAQVVEDGQPVDFGETLFIVDSGAQAPAPEEASNGAAADEASLVDIEPPRL